MTRGFFLLPTSAKAEAFLLIQNLKEFQAVRLVYAVGRIFSVDLMEHLLANSTS